jgi:hypothetical protein
LAALFVLATTGPVSWILTLSISADPRGGGPSQDSDVWLGLLVAFWAIPRIVLGPLIVLVETATCFLARDQSARLLLAAMILMDIIPLGLFLRHLTHQA